MTIGPAGRSTSLIGALTVSMLAFTACGGGDDGDASAPEAEDSSAATSTEAAEAVVASFPVGEPFGEAVWSVDVGEGEKTVTVRPDRVVVDRSLLGVSRAIQVYTLEGEEAWTHDLSDHEYPEAVSVATFRETVAVLTEREIEASGLDEARTVAVLTLLSLEDGSVVAEVEFPEENPLFSDHGAVFFTDDDGVSYVTEDGEIVKRGDDGFADGDHGLVHGTPFWVDRSHDLHTQAGGASEFPGVDRSDIIGMDVLAADHEQGLLAVQVTHDRSFDFTYHAVEAATGEVLYEFDCPGYTHTQGETDVASNSPNGQYAVHESIWISATGARCFGGEDGQRTVELQAVDDDGNAYGMVEGDGLESGELVTIPAGGEPEVSALPDGAPAPSGIMNGGIAVHLSGTMLTGNPIL